MKLNNLLPLLLIFFALPVFASGTQEEVSVTVYGAASTSDLVSAVSKIYKEKSGIEIKLNAASSGTLARQIEEGANPDIYISASGKWMKYVEGLDVISDSTVLMKNSLVLIAPIDTKKEEFLMTTESLLPDFKGRISVADPSHAPAGRYAVEAFKNLGWYMALEPRIQPGADVRKALSVVEFGETELGVVYKTDAVLSDKVKILATFPEESHSPIKYYCGLLKDASSEGSDFYNFITTDKDVAELIKEAGFLQD
ncbi:MAG: molybdate ABC transporter substrate-binding protein [Spirochaetales bacterium]|nr:molybdate ABC transporter substrate-binding protein [Spirochaetales bacterium]